MDYPFFTAKLANISQATRDALLACAKGAPVVRHGGFNTHQYIEQLAVTFPRDLLIKLIEEIGFFPFENFYGTRLDMLHPTQAITMHSDMSVASRENMYVCGHTHNIHIPLISNPDSKTYHKRCHDGPVEEKHLEVGGAYAFNDYVHHWVKNGGTTDRLHMIIYFHDPRWINKMDIVKSRNLRLDQYYEE